MIFEVYQRTDASIMKGAELSIAFLDRCSRPEFEKIRDFLNYCASHYPEKEFAELKIRLWNKNEHQFRSASFELLFHEMLLKSGCTLIPHPDMGNEKETKPEFLVTTSKDQKFILEAVCSSEFIQEKEGINLVKETIKDTLDALPHRNFRLILTEDGEPTSQPSGKKLRAEIHKWLDELDPDEIEEYEAKNLKEKIPIFEKEINGWHLRFRPMPIPRWLRGQSKLLISTGPLGSYFADGEKRIQNVINKKQEKYGDLKMPFVVSLNFRAFGYLPDEILNAYLENENRPSSRLSGLWFFDGIDPHNIASRSHALWRNPEAEYPLNDFFNFLPQLRIDEKGIHLDEGRSVHEILELPENWPK